MLKVRTTRSGGMLFSHRLADSYPMTIVIASLQAILSLNSPQIHHQYVHIALDVAVAAQGRLEVITT
jgi:hypothetical protein